jgi:hypothetical protein
MRQRVQNVRLSLVSQIQSVLPYLWGLPISGTLLDLETNARLRRYSSTSPTLVSTSINIVFFAQTCVLFAVLCNLADV